MSIGQFATLDDLIKDITVWQQATFPDQSISSVVAHLQEEAKELAADPTNTEELADVYMLALALAVCIGNKVEQLPNFYQVVEAKHAINKRRKWGKAPSGEYDKHVE